MSQGSSLRQTSKRLTTEKWVVAEGNGLAARTSGGQMIFIQSWARGFEMLTQSYSQCQREAVVFDEGADADGEETQRGVRSTCTLQQAI